jgi:hypothetical protein
VILQSQHLKGGAGYLKSKKNLFGIQVAYVYVLSREFTMYARTDKETCFFSNFAYEFRS